MLMGNGYSRRSTNSKILRFAKSERLVHWAIAGPFLVCFASASILFFVYNPDRSRRYRNLFSGIHRASGLALIVLPMVATLWCRGDMRIHWYNVKQAWTWMFDDFKWLFLILFAAICPAIKLPEQAKFNAGEKINFMVLLVTYPLYVASGLLLWITRVAPLSWLLHVFMAIFAAPLLLGHLYMAMINRSGRVGLPGIINGFVDRGWAKQHYRRWYRECHEATEPMPEIEADAIPSASMASAPDEGAAAAERPLDITSPTTPQIVTHSPSSGGANC
jgi:formate dehydrogenase subunit gamma